MHINPLRQYNANYEAVFSTLAKVCASSSAVVQRFMATLPKQTLHYSTIEAFCLHFPQRQFIPYSNEGQQKTSNEDTRGRIV